MLLSPPLPLLHSPTVHGPSREHLEEETRLGKGRESSGWWERRRGRGGGGEPGGFYLSTHTCTRARARARGIPPFEVPSRPSRSLAITRSSVCYCDLVQFDMPGVPRTMQFFSPVAIRLILEFSFAPGRLGPTRPFDAHETVEIGNPRLPESSPRASRRTKFLWMRGRTEWSRTTRGTRWRTRISFFMWKENEGNRQADVAYIDDASSLDMYRKKEAKEEHSPFENIIYCKSGSEIRQALNRHNSVTRRNFILFHQEETYSHYRRIIFFK